MLRFNFSRFLLCLFVWGGIIACEKESTVQNSVSTVSITKISAFARLSESITLSSGNRVFVGEDDGAAVIYLFDLNGLLLWERRIDHGGRSVFGAVAELPNGDIVAAGSTNSAYFNTKGQSTDLLFQCYSQSGNEIWTSVIGDTNDEFLIDLLIDSKGHCVATGSINSNFFRTLVIKVSNDGRFLWQREYAIDAFNYGRGILELADGRILLAGTTGNGGSTYPFIYLLNTAGYPVLEQAYPVYRRGIDKDRDNYSISIVPHQQGVVLCMFYLPLQRNYPTAQLLHIDLNGSVLQNKELFGLGNFRPSGMKKIGNDFLIYGASSVNRNYETYGFRESKSYVISLDENLNKKWESAVGSSEKVQMALDIVNQGETYSVGAFSQIQGVNSASLLHYSIDKSGNHIIK